MAKVTLQEMADRMLSEEYRQPLKTVAEALAANGWANESDPEDGEAIKIPMCCGVELEAVGMLGQVYHLECHTCGKFAHDVTGPSVGENSVRFVDTEKVDCTGYWDDHCWIAGTYHKD